MTSKIIVFTCIMFFGVSSAFSQDAKLMERVKEKLKAFKTEGQIKKTTAVAGVRGAEEKEESRIFWAGNDTVSEDELQLFKSGVDKLEQNDRSSAVQTFQIFLNKYPRSALSPDAYELLESLKK